MASLMFAANCATVVTPFFWTKNNLFDISVTSAVVLPYILKIWVIRFEALVMSVNPPTASLFNSYYP